MVGNERSEANHCQPAILQLLQVLWEADFRRVLVLRGKCALSMKVPNSFETPTPTHEAKV